MNFGRCDTIAALSLIEPEVSTIRLLSLTHFHAIKRTSYCRFIAEMLQIFCIFVCGKQPQNLFIMSVKVYVISDPLAINFLVDDDIEGFKEYLDSDDMLDFGEPEVFDTEAEALAFCSGIGYGANERATPDRYPLRSCEPVDLPFIEAIENY